MSDILVESFDKNVGASGDTLTLSNSVGATSKAFIRINNASDKASAGPTGDSSNINPNVGHVGAKLTAIDTITFYRNQSTQVKVIGEVWRYVGAAGGPNEFIVRGHYAVSISGASASQAVSGISNEDKCVPIITGVNTSEGSRSDYEQCTFAAHMDGSGNVVVSRNNSGTSATVYVTVVEFTGSNWTVGHGKSASHDTSTETVTLNTDSDGVSGDTFDVTDWETAFIEASMEGDSAETGLADVMALCYPHADTDKVYFSLTDADSAARNDGIGWIHVVRNSDLIVKRAVNTDVAEGNGSYGAVAWPSGANLFRQVAQTALEWFVSTSGTGTAHLRGRLGARITVGGVDFSDGDTITSGSYDSTKDVVLEILLTFASSPVGCIFEAGGTGTGAFIGYNDSGDFVARAGNGGSVAPSDVARLVVAPSTYDFAGKTGRLVVTISVDESEITVQFDEGNTGTFDYEGSDTAASAFANWSGGNDGGVGDVFGSSVAGSELTVTDFNGAISNLNLDQGKMIKHWVHRNGNRVVARYGVIDLSQLVSVTSIPLSGQSDGEATVSGAVTANRGVSGQSDGSGDVIGAIQAKRGVSGGMEGSAEVSGTLKAKRGILGQVDGATEVSGSLGAKRHLSGESEGEATVTSQLASDEVVGTFLHSRTRSLVKPISGRWNYFFLGNKLRQEVGNDLYV